MSERRGTPREESQEQGVSIIAKSLAPQIGSAQDSLIEQRIDERKFANLDPKVQQASIYFLYRGTVDKVRFFDFMVGNHFVTSQAINGLGKRQVLQAISAAAGNRGLEVAEKPNLLARNLWSRDWKSKAVQEGKVPVE